MRNTAIKCAVVAAVAWVIVTAGTAWAQTTTSTEVKSFEVISVAGNKLVVREPSGTREYTVPDDFRFDIADKKVPVTALQPGMKGTATFTRTTTSTPVYVTEVREAEVLRASGSSLLVRGPDGFRQYSPGEVEKRGITIMKNGRPVEFSDLNTGDRLTATIVTEGPPKTLTETQVKAVLSTPTEAVATAATTAAATTAPVATTVAATTAADATPAAATTAPVATTAAATTAAVASDAAQAAQSAATDAETASGMSMPLIIVVALALVALVWFVMTRRQRRS